MATNAVLTYRDGHLEIPEELQRAWHLHEGSRARVVYAAGGKVLLDTNAETEAPVADWRRLQGCLSHLSRSPNEDFDDERIRESELDARR